MLSALPPKEPTPYLGWDCICPQCFCCQWTYTASHVKTPLWTSQTTQNDGSLLWVAFALFSQGSLAWPVKNQSSRNTADYHRWAANKPSPAPTSPACHFHLTPPSLQLPKTPHIVILPCCSEFLAWTVGDRRLLPSWQLERAHFLSIRFSL